MRESLRWASRIPAHSKYCYVYYYKTNLIYLIKSLYMTQLLLPYPLYLEGVYQNQVLVIHNHTHSYLLPVALKRKGVNPPYQTHHKYHHSFQNLQNGVA